MFMNSFVRVLWRCVSCKLSFIELCMAVGGTPMQIPYVAIGGGHGSTCTMSCKMGMDDKAASIVPPDNKVGEFGLPPQRPGGKFDLYDKKLIKAACNVKVTMKRVSVHRPCMGHRNNPPLHMPRTGVLLPNKPRRCQSWGNWKSSYSRGLPHMPRGPSYAKRRGDVETCKWMCN